MKRLLAWLAGALLLLALAAAGLLFCLLDARPQVERPASISPESIAQARWLLLTNDPRRLRPGETRRIALPAALLDEGVNYAASRFLRGRGALALQAGAAGNTAEIRLALPLGPAYLNLNARLAEGAGPPRLAGARLGAFELPAPLAGRALETALRLTGHDREWALLKAAVRDLRIQPERHRLVVQYAWEPGLLDHARAAAVDIDTLARLRSAHEMLAGLLDHHAPNRRLGLPAVLGPLLDVGGADQVENRRAAILVLAAYLADKNLTAAIPEAADWPRLRPLQLMLRGRHDSAQHFVVSAALAAWAGEPLADAVGLYKELADARQGSGFSFADLAADRAGTRFGELLAHPPGGRDPLPPGDLADDMLAPPLADLPENMHEDEFLRRFGGRDTPAYRRMTEEIERRVAALPLYRNLPSERP